MNRSPNKIANWLAASFKIRGDIIQPFCDVSQGQKQEFGRCFVARKVAAILYDLTQLHVQTLNRIGPGAWRVRAEFVRSN